MDPRRLLFLPLFALALHAGAQVVLQLDTLDIRPSGEDFAPALTDSGLVFTSVRAREQAIAYTDATTGKPLADLYHVRLKDGKPGRPHLMDGSLCSPFNDGPAAFSPGGDTICFTRNSSIGKRREAGSLGLFFAVKQGGTWTEPVPFAWNGADFNTMDACFSSDGKQLYFASDRPGGRGGMDLYRCIRDGQGWSEPQELGRGVNTKYNEAYPSCLHDGRLAFSSDRAGGAGKLDLYTTRYAYGEWESPLAMPVPLNSPGNDLGYTAYPDGRSGFFSSDRAGSDRIYGFHAAPVPFRNCAEEQVNSYCYHFEDAGAAGADTLPLRYEWDFGDGTRVAALSADHCYARPGTYQVKLDLIDTLSECVYANQVGYVLEVADVEQPIIHGPDSVGTGLALALDTAHTQLPGFLAKEVHWDLGDSTFTTGASVAHSYAKAGVYTVRLDLIGGPDGTGDFVNHCVFRKVVVKDGMRQDKPAETPAPSGPAPEAGATTPEQR